MHGIYSPLYVITTAAAAAAASRASDKCLRERRKTINGDDLLWAMQTLGFEEYQEPLKIYLQKFREAEVGQVQGSCRLSAVSCVP